MKTTKGAPYKPGDTVVAVTTGRYSSEKNLLKIGKVYIVDKCEFEDWNGKGYWYLSLRGQDYGQFTKEFVPSCELAKVLMGLER